MYRELPITWNSIYVCVCVCTKRFLFLDQTVLTIILLLKNKHNSITDYNFDVSV